MYLPLLILIISTIAVVMAWQDSKSRLEKGIMIVIYLLVAGICFQCSSGMRMQLLEGFEVQIPDIDETMESLNSTTYNGNNSYMDKEEESMVNTTDSNSNSNTTDNKRVKFNQKLEDTLTFDHNDTIDILRSKKQANTGETFNDIVQQDTHGKHNSVFNPQIIINAPQENIETGENIVKRLMGNTSDTIYESQFQNNNMTSKNNEMANTFKNIKTHNKSISDYLKPNPELFENQDTSTTTTKHSTNDSNMWEQYVRNYSNDVNNGRSACSFSYPYAEDKYNNGNNRNNGNNKGFNSKTLTNKTFVPGMQYMPPSNWDVPQYHPTACRSVCPSNMLNTRSLPIGIMDHGTPINALEIGSDGTIAKTESDNHLTNVGSMLPKFIYREYIECPIYDYQGNAPQTTAPQTTAPQTTES